MSTRCGDSVTVSIVRRKSVETPDNPAVPDDRFARRWAARIAFAGTESAGSLPGALPRFPATDGRNINPSRNDRGRPGSVAPSGAARHCVTTRRVRNALERNVAPPSYALGRMRFSRRTLLTARRTGCGHSGTFECSIVFRFCFLHPYSSNTPYAHTSRVWRRCRIAFDDNRPLQRRAAVDCGRDGNNYAHRSDIKTINDRRSCVAVTFNWQNANIRYGRFVNGLNYFMSHRDRCERVVFIFCRGMRVKPLESRTRHSGHAFIIRKSKYSNRHLDRKIQRSNCHGSVLKRTTVPLFPSNSPSLRLLSYRFRCTTHEPRSTGVKRGDCRRQ